VKRVICVIGTRPEAIKMAPVVKALQARGLQAPILATAQHRHLLDQVLEVFDLSPTWDLDAMKPNQSLAGLTGSLVPTLDELLGREKPDMVLAQGDTTTVFCAALASYYRQIPFGHVEAGLRSGDLFSPFPEEGIRRLTGQLTQLHFAPTDMARRALLREGYPEKEIHVVGNTVIDALFEMVAKPNLPWPTEVPALKARERLALITLHRRENFGAPLKRILESLKAFALRHPDTRLVYPVHPNPNVQTPAREILANIPNVHLLEPVEYPQLVALMKACHAAFTDSGGIQEEAPALGKPVLVFRDVTERAEAVEAGGVTLVGSDPEAFHQEAESLWNDEAHYSAMAKPRFPYGDGTAARQLADIVGTHLQC
jgi:UDP-N-acetylglucosamine 2-epimerase (non-hydrolysing)